MTAFPDELRELYRTGTRLVYLVTEEEERAVEACRAAFAPGTAAPGAPQVAVWSRTRGLEGIAPEARDGRSLLDALARRRERPLVAVLLDFHEELVDRDLVRRLRDDLAALGGLRHSLVVVAPRLVLPQGLRTEVTVLHLPLPNHEELAAILDPIAPDRGRATAHALVTAAAGLTAAQASRAFRRACDADPELGELAVRVVLAEKQRTLARDHGLDVVEVREGPDSLGGLDAFKEWMQERALAFAPDARSFGLPPPRGVMLVGVQGCGKSLAAKVAAAMLRVPLIRLDLPRVLGAGEGATEGLARALASAEAVAPVALWVDEIEKGFAGSAQGEGGDPRAARLLGAFSTWLQERSAPVFVVATANDVTRLPPELLRRGRFDELFFVDLPDAEARQRIVALHLAKRGRSPEEFDLPAIAEACADYSGAEIEQVVVGALHRAYSLAREVETQDLRRLAQDLVPLSRTYEEAIKALREWSRGRARRAAQPPRIVDLFRRVPD